MAISYSLVDDAGGRFQIDSSLGVVTSSSGVVAAYNDTLLVLATNQSHDIIVRATSTDPSTADVVFTLSVLESGIPSSQMAAQQIDVDAGTRIIDEVSHTLSGEFWQSPVVSVNKLRRASTWPTLTDFTVTPDMNQKSIVDAVYQEATGDLRIRIRTNASPPHEEVWTFT